MARDIDQKKTRKALRKLRKARDRAESEDGPGLTDWEQEFVEGVEERLSTYGSAFNDPEKGTLDEALSHRQTHIIKQIDKKARGKGMKRSSFKSKSQERRSNSRDINEDTAAPTPHTEPASPDHHGPRLIHQADNAAPNHGAVAPRPPKSAFRVIEGGKSDTCQK